MTSCTPIAFKSVPSTAPTIGSRITEFFFGKRPPKRQRGEDLDLSDLPSPESAPKSVPIPLDDEDHPAKRLRMLYKYGSEANLRASPDGQPPTFTDGLQLPLMAQALDLGKKGGKREAEIIMARIREMHAAEAPILASLRPGGAEHDLEQLGTQIRDGLASPDEITAQIATDVQTERARMNHRQLLGDSADAESQSNSQSMADEGNHSGKLVNPKPRERKSNKETADDRDADLHTEDDVSVERSKRTLDEIAAPPRLQNERDNFTANNALKIESPSGMLSSLPAAPSESQNVKVEEGFPTIHERTEHPESDSDAKRKAERRARKMRRRRAADGKKPSGREREASPKRESGVAGLGYSINGGNQSTLRRARSIWSSRRLEVRLSMESCMIFTPSKGDENLRITCRATF